MVSDAEMRSDELTILLEITSGFNAGWGVDQILNSLYQKFKQILPYDRMEYAVLEDDGYVLTTSWVRSSYRSKAVPAGYRYRRDRPIAGNPRYLVPFLDNDLPVYASKRPSDHPVGMLVADGLKSSLNCPLLIGGRITGFLFFNSLEPDRYTVRHSSLIQLIAGHLASALGQSELNEQLKSRNRELKQMEKSRLQFIASISHELRTPLTAVVGFASELQDRFSDFSPEECSQFVSLIATQSTEVAGIVEDLLVITRAEAGHLAIESNRVDVAREVRCVGESMAAEREDHEVSFDLDEGVALADGLRVRQIARNLLSNASRHGGPMAEVKVRHVDDSVLVTVTDNGEGIPEKDRETVFEAFRRGNVTPGRTGSIGLGLTVSRYLAEAMGGSVSYERTGDLSRFSLSLPRYSGQNEDSSVSSAPQ